MAQAFGSYRDEELAKRCRVCGAQAGQPCRQLVDGLTKLQRSGPKTKKSATASGFAPKATPCAGRH